MTENGFHMLNVVIPVSFSEMGDQLTGLHLAGLFK